MRDPEKFAAMRAPLSVSHPELDDFCDDYTAEFIAFCADTGKTHVIVSKSVHEAAIEPPSSTISGFTPKKAGFHS
ncbi:hypothetical protein ACC708_36750, partial [Rhizobium ruizarguesonis]